MAQSVVMPALEMAQDTGRLVKWRKQEGERVSKGELLMDVETDKAIVEIEAEAEGILSAVRAREGDVITVGQVIAWILAPGEAPPADAAPAASGPAPSASSSAATRHATAPAAVGGDGGGRPLMSPKARRLAAERGLDPRTLAGAAGVITAKDVAVSGSAGGQAPGTVWRVMAERMASAWTTVPQFVLTRSLDATTLVAFREGAGNATGVTVTDVLVHAVARAIGAHPRVNASWADGTVRYYQDVNIGLAVAVEQAVVVPVLHGADRLSIGEIAARRQALISRARDERLTPADLANGRFTISNLGGHGVDAFTAIVTPPEAAILAVGAIREQVVARDGAVVVRPMMTVSLSCDHRVLDGARAAAFLNDLVRIIETGEGLA